MKSSTTPDFWAAYRGLPQNVRELARKNYRLWQENTSHRSLDWKQLTPGLWSVRIGLKYRALQRLRDRAALIACHSGDENSSAHILFLPWFIR